MNWDPQYDKEKHKVLSLGANPFNDWIKEAIIENNFQRGRILKL